jgi:hypothetical protein
MSLLAEEHRRIVKELNRMPEKQSVELAFSKEAVVPPPKAHRILRTQYQLLVAALTSQTSQEMRITTGQELNEQCTRSD